jgi:hypothetical protein
MTCGESNERSVNQQGSCNGEELWTGTPYRLPTGKVCGCSGAV